MRVVAILLVCLTLSTGVALAQVSTRAENAVIEALSRGDVYIAPQLAGTVDEGRLQQVANELKPFTVKFVVVPLRDKSTRNRWATTLRRHLDVRNGAVIVLTPKTEDLQGGVSASSDVISAREVDSLVQANIRIFTTEGYTQGLERLARAMRDFHAQERRSATVGTLALLGIPTLLVVGGVAWVIRRRAREVARLKARLQEMRQQVLEGIEYLDGYMDVLPAGEDASRAREHRQKAAELQAQAVELIDTARRPEQLWRAEHLLDKAQMSVERAKKYILRAGGDTSILVEEEPEEPVEEVDLMIRPNDRTYACFFCSKPPTLGELQPVEVTIGEQTQKVWACEECAESIRRGETPSVRVFRDGDQVRPWYDNPNYDPYRDYGRRDPGMDWMSLLLLGSILTHPAPVIIHDAPDQSGSDGADASNTEAGGADFFGYPLAGSDAGETEAGGADFFDVSFAEDADTTDANVDGADFFDSFFLGGFDSGDTDAGGADFGDFGDFGGDAGGGDF